MMKQIKTRSMIGAAFIALLLVAAVPVLGQVEFTFEGFAMTDMGTDMVGSTYTVYGIGNPPVSAPTPLPLDFANYEYTIAVTGMSVSMFSLDALNNIKDYAFVGGTIRIYEDALVGGTAADYANPATITDGTMLLEASVHDGWEMLLDNPLGPPFGTYAGSGIGACDLIGGSELGTLIGIGFPLTAWTFAGTGIAEPSFFITVPAGYDLAFGTKIIFPYDPTPNEDRTFGELKNLYR